MKARAGKVYLSALRRFCVCVSKSCKLLRKQGAFWRFWAVLSDCENLQKKPAKLVFVSILGLFEMVVREGFEPPNGKPNGFTVHAL